MEGQEQNQSQNKHMLISFKKKIILTEEQQQRLKGLNLILYLDNGILESQQWIDLLNSIEKVSYNVVALNKNYHSNVLKNICHIHFSSLTMLNVSQNNIRSLETLSRFDTPLLKHLDLSKNHISSIRSLVKAYLPSLQIINLKTNALANKQSMFQSFFPKLRQFRVDEDKDDCFWAEPAVWRIKHAPILRYEEQVPRNKIFEAVVENCFIYFVPKEIKLLACQKYRQSLRYKPYHLSSFE